MMPHLPRTTTTACLSGWSAAAVALALLSTPLAANNGSAGQSTERQKAQPLILKIKRDYNIRTPRRGEAKDSVKNRFGAPEAVRGPVGEPPITRWQYPRFEVVFEKDWVIHTVVEPDSNS